METPLKNKILAKLLQQGDGFQTPAGCSSGGDRSNRHITSVTKLPSSPFLQKLGFGTGIAVLRIKRSPVKNSNRSPWAIKMLNRRTNPDQAKMIGNRLTEEAKILKTLNHPNIVGFRDFDSLEAGKEYIAMEYCNTSLGDLLQRRYDEALGPLEAPKIERMATDVLNALNYLHTEALILHGDLKSFNVLVKNDFEVCKLCDFGVSLPLTKDGFLDTEKKEDAQYVGTGIWSAPEVLEEDISLISSKADIFSFGLVLYETITLLPPHTYPGMKDESIASSADYAIMKSIIRGNNAGNRVLEPGEVIVLEDDETEDEKDGPLSEQGVKRKLSLDDSCVEGQMMPQKKSTSEPDSTTDGQAVSVAAADESACDGGAQNQSIITVADESTAKVEESVITIDDDEDDDEEELDDDCEDVDDEEDEDFEDEEEEYFDEGEEDEEGDYLDYGRLGTRPAIPDNITLSDEYNFIMEMFFVCTQDDYELRPSAQLLLDAWQKKAESGAEPLAEAVPEGQQPAPPPPDAAVPDEAKD